MVLLWDNEDATPFLVCLGMALAASTMKVALPGLTGTISPAFLFVLLAIGKLSWPEAVTVGAAGGFMQCLWRAKARPSGLQAAFNAATLAISTSLAYGIGHRLAPIAAAYQLALAIAGVVLLVSNSLLVATVLCLIQDAPWRTVFRAIQLWSVPYYLAGGMLASVWVQADLTAGATMAVLMLITAYLLDTCYRQVVNRALAAG